jgi:hypothetical protein
MEAVSANGAGGETAALSAFGRQWGTAEMFALGRRANENPPKLYTFNPKGFRRDVVEFHPAYHDLMRASIAAGLHASTWTATGKRASPPAKVARAAMPLRSLSPRSSSSKRLPRSFRVPSAMTTLFGSAIPCRRLGQGLLGASLGKHALAGAVRRQSERDQPLFSGQSTTHRGTGNAPFPAQLGPSSAWR